MSISRRVLEIVEWSVAPHRTQTPRTLARSASPPRAKQSLVPIRSLRKIPASTVGNTVPVPDSGAPSSARKKPNTNLQRSRRIRSAPKSDSIACKKDATRFAANLVLRSTSTAGEVFVSVCPWPWHVLYAKMGKLVDKKISSRATFTTGC